MRNNAKICWYSSVAWKTEGVFLYSFNAQDPKHAFLTCSVGSITSPLLPIETLLSCILYIYKPTIGFLTELQICLRNKLYFGFLGQQLEVSSAQVYSGLLGRYAMLCLSVTNLPQGLNWASLLSIHVIKQGGQQLLSRNPSVQVYRERKPWPMPQYLKKDFHAYRGPGVHFYTNAMWSDVESDFTLLYFWGSHLDGVW